MSDADFSPHFHLPERGNQRLTLLIYALQAASFLVGLTLVVAVVINYVKRREMIGTWLESHFRWQIRTFWFSLLWSAIGLVTLPLLIGYPILVADMIWLIYRIVKGGLSLYERREMYR
jgi:uncharacterized membrane protein